MARQRGGNRVYLILWCRAWRWTSRWAASTPLADWAAHWELADGSTRWTQEVYYEIGQIHWGDLRVKRQRRSTLGAPAELHRQNAESTAREVRRLVRAARSALKISDCAHAATLLNTIAYQGGVLIVERREDGKSRWGRLVRASGAGPAALFRKFVSKCVIKTKPKYDQWH